MSAAEDPAADIPDVVAQVADEVGPAWREATQGEHRWPVALVVVITISIQYLLPAELVFQPQWIAPTIEVALLIALIGFVSTIALAKFLMRGEVIE